MAIRREYSGNAAATTLTTSISNVTSTINIASATGWPTGAVGPFVTTLDAGTASEEKVLVLSRSGTALTVSTRGYDGTTATSHGLGASIIHSYSATDADEANALAAQVTTSGGTVVTTSSIPASVATLTGTQVLTNKTINGASYGENIGFRNVIRNGDMGVWQRGGGPFTTGYSADGVQLSSVGGTFTVSRNILAPGSFGGSQARYSCQAVTAGQAAAGDLSSLVFKVEDVRTLAGLAVTCSFVAAAASGTPKIGVEVGQNFGNGGSPSAAVNTAVQAVTLSTTATRYSVSFTVPSITGKTIGTNEDSYLSLNLWLSAGATFAARASSIGIQNATINVTDVQLEAGGLTAFERLPQQQQLAWCQRYFWRHSSASNALTRFATGQCYATTAGAVVDKFPVPMRAVPTAVASGAATFGVLGAGGGLIPLSSLTASVIEPGGANLDLTVAAGLVAGNAAIMFANSTTTAIIDYTAEL